MVAIKVTVKPSRLPITSPNASAIIAGEVRSTMQAATLLAQRAAQERTPVGATSILRGSIQQEVRGAGVELAGVVFTNQVYGVAVEEGTRPHWAPIGPLLLWAQRKLGDRRLAYAVRAKIARQGTKGKHMFRDAGREVRGQVRSMFRAMGGRLRKGLGA